MNMNGMKVRRTQSNSSSMELTSNSSTATPRSSGGSRKLRQKVYTNTRLNVREVDAIKNPTHLFQKINSGDWEGASDALHERPADAGIWISRQKQSNGDADISWKYLPLHLVCLQKRPPLKLLQQLLEVFPNAASMSTPHDGNLAMHYACESGCESHDLLSGVLAALLDAYPQSLEVKNFKGKTPLLLCSAKTRQVLMGLLRARKPSPTTPKKNRYECRNDDMSAYSPREKPPHHREHRQSPPLNAQTLPPLVDDDSEGFDDESEDESEGNSSWHSDAHTPSSQSRLNRDAPSPRSLMDPSSCTENELRQKVEALSRQNKSQQHTISQLNERLKHLTKRDEDNVAEDAKLLCQRILAKAEADSVKFRTQIQQVQAEKEQLKEDASRREKVVLETLTNIRDVLMNKGLRMKLNLFDEETESIAESTASQDPSSKHNSLPKQIVEALGTIIAKVETSEDKLRDHIKTLEDKVSNYEVQHKTVQSVNQNLRHEKEVLIKKQRDLERNIIQLKDEKESIEKSLVDTKEKNSSLIVMTRSLQRQIDNGNETDNENGAVREHFQFNDVDSDQGDGSSPSVKALQHTLEENKSKIAALLKEQEALKEKNRSLKDTILMNNEKYLNKVQELGEKYSSLEKVNSDLRKRINESSSKNSKARSSLKVSLEGEDELLYEV